MVKPAPNALRRRSTLHQVKPVEEEVIVVEQVAPLLRLHVGSEQMLQFLTPVGTPWESQLEGIVEALARVHRVGVDRQACGLPREPCGLLGKAELSSDEIEK